MSVWLFQAAQTPRTCSWVLCYSSFFAYRVVANFLLNLSIRPAVSTNFILPVKKGWDLLEISNFTRGYSFPSSHVILSLVGAQERVRKASPQEKSLKTTILYSFGCVSFFILIFCLEGAKIANTSIPANQLSILEYDRLHFLILPTLTLIP